eukprot:SAG31_NODE_36773_length_310_cov_0.976303_1_plen_78_part_10
MKDHFAVTFLAAIVSGQCQTVASLFVCTSSAVHFLGLITIHDAGLGNVQMLHPEAGILADICEIMVSTTQTLLSSNPP